MLQINLTIATKSGQPMGSAVNLVRNLHRDPVWNINFIELVDSADNSEIYKRYNCHKESPFVAINGQAALYGFGEIQKFLFRLKGVKTIVSPRPTLEPVESLTGCITICRFSKIRLRA